LSSYSKAHVDIFQLRRTSQERRGERVATNAPARSHRKISDGDAAPSRNVAYPAQRTADGGGNVNAEIGEHREACRHQALAARFVERRRPSLQHNHLAA